MGLFFLMTLKLLPSLIEVLVETQGHNLEAGTEAEAGEELCLLACYLWLPQPTLLYSQNHLPRSDTVQCGVYQHTSIIKEKVSYKLAYKQSDVRIFSIEVHLSR